jgi:uncharacterized protein
MKTLALALLLPVLLRSQDQSSSASKPVSGQSAGAPAVDPAFAADIHRLLEDAGMMQLLAQEVDQMMGPTIALMKQNPDFTPEFVDETMRRAKKKLLGPQMEEIAVQAYAKYFTRDDIQQMIAYQESPVGRKAKQIMPQMLADLNTDMRAFGEKAGQEAAMEVVKEHPEYLKKPASSEPAAQPPKTQ